MSYALESNVRSQNHGSILSSIRLFGRLSRLYAAGTPPLFLLAGAFANGSPTTISIIVLFAMGVLIGMGYMALNDYFDIEVDRRSHNVRHERPMASGEISPIIGFIFGLSCIAMIFVLGLLFFGTRILLPLIVAASLGLAYDAFNKTYPGLDILGTLSISAAVVVGALAVNDSISMLTWVYVALFGLRGILQNVVEGGIKDMHEDRESGARTTAVRLLHDSDEVSVAMRLTAYALEGAFIIFLAYSLWLIGPSIFGMMLFFAFLVLSILTFAKGMPRPYNREVTKRFMYPHEMLSILAMFILLAVASNTMLPILLFIIPIIWFLAWNMIIYGNWKPAV
ncbi:MAG: UbiA family prenyltransferase [Candidatus Thermoplasmatota archaeon]|nr:UbiA family prenyltransferase [Candidatus Thermoplasmatota archaeon]